MRVFFLVIGFILISLSACANEVNYELCIVESLKTRLTLRTLNEKCLEEFKNSEYVVVKSEEYGELQLKIISGTKNAEGVIPFAKWTIIGVKKGGVLKTQPFGGVRAKEQVIRDVELSRGLYLENTNVGLLKTTDFKLISCKGEAVQLCVSGSPGKGIFALLLSDKYKYIGQYYRKPNEKSIACIVPCGSYYGPAILCSVYFEECK